MVTLFSIWLKSQRGTNEKKIYIEYIYLSALSEDGGGIGQVERVVPEFETNRISWSALSAKSGSLYPVSVGFGNSLLSCPATTTTARFCPIYVAYLVLDPCIRAIVHRPVARRPVAMDSLHSTLNWTIIR